FRDVDLRRSIHDAGLPPLDDHGVALFLPDLREDTLQVAEDLRAHRLLLLLQLLLQVVEEAPDVPRLALESFLLLPPGVRGEELALLPELVPELVVVTLLAIDLLLHGGLLLLDLLASLYAGLRAGENALEIHVAHPGGGRRRLRHRRGQCPPQARQHHEGAG